jgi:dihydrofolate reductase
MLLGRKTYELFSAYWPKITTGPEKSFADKLNAMPKVVFSKTLERAPWEGWDDARIVRRGLLKEVAGMKAQRGKDMIVWGSISIAQALMRRGLVDEYLLMVCPVVLGHGKPLFRGKLSPHAVRLTKVAPFDRGTAQLSYDATNTRVA